MASTAASAAAAIGGDRGWMMRTRRPQANLAGSRYSLQEQQGPFSPWGEGGPKGRMRGPSQPQVAPHQLGQMTCGRATKLFNAARAESAPASHGLTSSPPRGEGTRSEHTFISLVLEGEAEHARAGWASR